MKNAEALEGLAIKSTARLSKKNVQAITNRFAKIRKATGALTPRAIVDDARDPKSPLHEYFDWDDSSAAEKYRLLQAGNLVRSIQVVVVDDDGKHQPTRHYLHVEIEQVPQYVPLLEVARNPTLSAQVLTDARNQLEGWKRRFGVYAELAQAVDRLEGVMGALDDLTSDTVDAPESES